MSTDTTPDLGWRIWHLTPDGNLKSIWGDRKSYTTSTITAKCKRGQCPEIPGPTCECGIFFVAERHVISQQAFRWAIWKKRAAEGERVAAVVTLIQPVGRTRPGPRTFGGANEWRSTAAEIKGIAIDPALSGFSQQLATTYQAPVLPGLTDSVLSILERAHRSTDDIAANAIIQRYNTPNVARTIIARPRCKTIGCPVEPSAGMNLCLKHRGGGWAAIL